MEIEIALNDKYIIPKWPLIFYDDSIFVVIILFCFPRTFAVSLTLNGTPEVSHSDRKNKGRGREIRQLSNRVRRLKKYRKSRHITAVAKMTLTLRVGNYLDKLLVSR